jgi:hypothetical protein
LSEALAPVLRDLENSGTLLPDILTEQERAFDGRVSAMFYGKGGSGRASPRWPVNHSRREWALRSSLMARARWTG